MGKSTPQAPTPPDPVATAAAQQGMNINTAVANANLNRINQYTPQGSLTYQKIGTNPDGTPQYQSTQTYSPEQQQLYQGQTAVSNALTGTAQSAISDVNQAYSTPYSTANIPGVQYGAQAGPIAGSYASGGPIQSSLNFSNLTALPGSTDFSADAQKARDAAYSQATSRLDPQFNLEQQQLASSLAAKGVTENSQAYRNAMDEFARQKTDAYNQANYGSYAAGGQEQSRLFGLALQSRQEGAQEALTQGQFTDAAQEQANKQNLGAAAFANAGQQQGFAQSLANVDQNNAARTQAIQEYSAQRNEPINRIATLLGSGAPGVTNPSFATPYQAGVQGVDYTQLVQNQFNAQQQQYNQQIAARNAGLGSIFGLAGSLGGAAIGLSDRRLKYNIHHVGYLNNGIPTYVFSFLGSKLREFGVMADEVMKVMPDAVIANDNGYMMVDYRKVYNG